MKPEVRRSLIVGACGMLLAGLSSSVFAQDEPAEEGTFAIEVVLDESAAADEAESEAQNPESAAENVAVGVFLADPVPIAGGEEATAADSTARLRLRLIDQNAPHSLNIRSLPVQGQFYLPHGLTTGGRLTFTQPADDYLWYLPMQAGPMQMMVLPTENPRLPHVLRVVPRIVGGEGGAFAAYYDATTGEQITGEELSDQSQWEPGEYMIGVSLGEIDSDVLRQHLGIEAEVGLVVEEVFENSPAQTAGVQVGDILLKVGETALKSPQDLVDAVQAFSADSGNALSIEVIQSGERKTLAVTPTTRQELLGYDIAFEHWRAIVQPGGDQEYFSQLLVTPQVARAQAYRDYVQAYQPDNGLAQSIQSLADQVARLQEAIDRLEQKLEE